MKRSSKPEPVRFHIRWQIRRDLPEVLGIETANEGDFAWQEADFLKALRQRNVIGMVAEIGEIVVGFCVYELQKHCLNVLRFSVSPPWQRRGIGTAMVAKLVSKLPSHRRFKIRFDVHERRVGLQQFLQSQGLLAVSIERGQFVDSDDDLFIFEYLLPSVEDLLLTSKPERP